MTRTVRTPHSNGTAPASMATRILKCLPRSTPHSVWPALAWLGLLLACGVSAAETSPAVSRLELTSSSAYLADGFAWARKTALSKVHPDNGGCYQAALPDRGGYCQRDYIIGFDHPGRRPVNGFGYETSWFIPYTGLCEPGPRATAYLDFIHASFQARPSPNIEAWSYLPDVFYSWNQNERGWQYFKHVLDSRSGYPEISFAVLSHLATRILGIEPDAPARAITTFGRLPGEIAWAQLDHLPLGANDVLVRHESGNRHTTVENRNGPELTWHALFPGTHAVIEVDGSPVAASPRAVNGTPVSGVSVPVKPGQRRTAAVSPVGRDPVGP